jgi:hypothetical protein
MSWLRQFPIKILWRMFYIVLVFSLILDLILLYFHIFHYHFSFQYIPEFFALFGLFGCILLILIAKGLGYFIVTDEDYYKRRSRR